MNKNEKETMLKINILVEYEERKNLLKKLKEAGMKSPEINLNKWCSGASTISPKSLGILFNVTKISKDSFNKQIREFIDEVYDKYNKNKRTLPYTRELNFAFIDKYIAAYAGYYYGWMKWVNTDNPEKSIYKLLMKIENSIINKSIKINMNTFKHYSKTNNPVWGFSGVLSHLVKARCLFFALENSDNVTKKDGYTTLHVYEGLEEPERGLWGIYTAEPSIQSNYTPVPTATRIFLKRVNNVIDENPESLKKMEKELMDKMGWFSEEEVCNEVDINKLKNDLDEVYQVLTVP